MSKLGLDERDVQVTAEATNPAASLVVFSTSKEQKDAAGSWTSGPGRKLSPPRGSIAVKDADVGSFVAD